MARGKLPARFMYQEMARQKILIRRKTAVLAPPGSGKTRPIIEALYEMDALYGRTLVVCSSIASNAWINQVPEWTEGDVPSEEVHYVSSGGWDLPTRQTGIFICNSAVFLRDFDAIAEIKWDALVIDEYHKFMRNRSTTYKKLLWLARRTPIVVPLTGSWWQKDPSSMFTVFQICQPKIWTSYWDYVKMFCHVMDGPYGKEIIGTRNIENFRKAVDRYLVYIPEDAVAAEMPEGHRYPIDVQMDCEQQQIYEDLITDMMAVVGEEVVVAKNMMSVHTKLRKLLCCPKLISPDLGMGAGYAAILEDLDVREDTHCAIFVPFRDACEYVVEDLRAQGYMAEFIRGQMDPREAYEVVQKVKQARGILVCTIAYGESYDYETATQSYFLGYDFIEDQLKQCEGRTRRAISAAKFVRWGYIRYRGTIDDYHLARISHSRAVAKQAFHRPEEFIAMLQGRLQETEE